ncbi:MAG: tRNA 4-thiouridine(8) synthase ThiI [Mycoplasma sp.]
MVKQIIYIKYGELTLKGKNRINFVDCLFTNIKKALINFDVKLTKAFDHTLIETSQDLTPIIEVLKFIPGVFKIIPAYLVDSSDFNTVSNQVVNSLKNEKFTTFKVDTKRQDKTYPLNSMEFSKQLGGVILKNFNGSKVLMNNYELLINVEIKKNEVIYYFKSINGIGGFPVGISGKALVLISGGIDSPVASALMMKKGMHVDFLTFMTPPHTSDKSLEKVKSLVKQVTLNGLIEKPKLFVCEFTHIQHELSHISDSSYQITLMRRYFLRIAQELLKQYKYDCIVTGESLGQVASQTIQSMQTIESVLDPSTILLRPLLTFDKLEIIKLAKYYQTYDISILPYADCCSLFVPKQPTTKPNKEIATKLEQELDLVEAIYRDTLKKFIKIID